MTVPALVSFAVLFAVGGWILAPLFRSDAVEAERSARRLSERAELLSRKEQMLSALRDLEDDRETGKINDRDYRDLHGKLTAEAAAILERLDALEAEDASRVVRSHPSAVPPRS